ncbi:SHOCT domain-containing protein [Limosilactobacillus balticus]|uniref:SHOCT domain-containing protein n=1 Tax=Limosilactobacillus balticus TaxID=2759747 RepID=UPI001E3A2176|nr:SHOCT domain-containing protein [Limosilactobacillus balticus]MCD7137248.1 SHOCT domain-containing protein [Limosilactobacillus balticus]
MQKELISRRLIAGVILALFALYTGYIGIQWCVAGTQEEGLESMVSIGGDLVILAAINLIVGITFAATSYMFPKKWLDITLVALAFLADLVCLIEFPQSEFSNATNWEMLIICVVLVVLAMPWSTKGYHNMPYNGKITVNTEANSAVINNTDSFEQIAKLKSLLDDGAITQEEYDAKKKQLLNL